MSDRPVTSWTATSSAARPAPAAEGDRSAPCRVDARRDPSPLHPSESSENDRSGTVPVCSGEPDRSRRHRQSSATETLVNIRPCSTNHPPWHRSEPKSAPGSTPSPPSSRTHRVRVSVMEGFDDSAVAIERAKAWQQRLAEGGWAALNWPRPVRRSGRLGARVDGVQRGAGALRRARRASSRIGISMIGPTIIAHGSDEQKQRYLRPMLAGAEIWCQLWSEPGAGSDLAALRTTAPICEGDEFVLNGQKVWTSGAHYCDFGLGIFRTDPDVPKHHGISCLIVDARLARHHDPPPAPDDRRRPFQRGVLRRRARAGREPRRRRSTTAGASAAR